MARHIRLRLPELFEERELTPYAVSRASGGRLSMSTAYRLVRLRGRLATFDARVLEALCDVLKVKPGELVERVDRAPDRPKRQRKPRR